jgi:hypothetical protein
MSLNHLLKSSILIAVLLSLGSATAMAAPATFSVSLNTSSLVGLGQFSLAFQLADGSGLGDANNTVSLHDFNFHGGSTGSVGGVFGGATGNFSSGVSLTDTDAFFNAMFQSFTPGTSVSFLATLSNNADAGPFQDLFAMSLLDGSGTGIPTLDTNGNDTLLTITLDGNLNPPLGAWGTDPQRSALHLAAPDVARIPEPGSLMLLVSGFAAGLCVLHLRRSPAFPLGSLDSFGISRRGIGEARSTGPSTLSEKSNHPLDRGRRDLPSVSHCETAVLPKKAFTH